MIKNIGVTKQEITNALFQFSDLVSFAIIHPPTINGIISGLMIINPINK